MADPTVTVAVVSGVFALSVAVVGTAGTFLSSRRGRADPPGPSGSPADVAVLSAGLQAVVREKDEMEAQLRAALAAATQRALACEAREAARGGKP